MPHPVLLALRIVAGIVFLAVLTWGAYTLAQMRKVLEQLKKP